LGFQLLQEEERIAPQAKVILSPATSRDIGTSDKEVVPLHKVKLLREFHFLKVQRFKAFKEAHGKGATRPSFLFPKILLFFYFFQGVHEFSLVCALLDKLSSKHFSLRAL
jgi:hypothetical protein